MTLEQAQALCEKLKASANGELADEALDAVAGGQGNVTEETGTGTKPVPPVPIIKKVYGTCLD